MATIKVDKGNHPRRGSITKYPEEIDQVFLDIRTWYDENAKDIVRNVFFTCALEPHAHYSIPNRTQTACLENTWNVSKMHLMRFR